MTTDQVGRVRGNGSRKARRSRLGPTRQPVLHSHDYMCKHVSRGNPISETTWLDREDCRKWDLQPARSPPII